jgi:hypothetical protein
MNFVRDSDRSRRAGRSQKEAKITLILPRLGALGSAWPVQIGTLWHSAWVVENVLQKFCKQIFALTDDPQFPYCLVGSGTAIKIAGRHFVFCCRHQIHEYTPDKIAIPLSFDTKIMSATTTRALKVTDENRDGDTIDVAAFEFEIEHSNVANLTNEFFPIEDARVWPTGAVRMPFMAFGYPSQRQQFDENRIGAKCIEIQASYDGGSLSPHLQRMRMQKTLDADGMSGGPVFYIGGAPGNYFAGFAGMLMRGGSDANYLHFMSAGFMIDLTLNHRQHLGLESPELWSQVG